MKSPFPRWVLYTASRYLSARGRNSGSPSAMVAVIGIAVGVFALTVVLSVMNGFQLGFIESILEISSFHIRVESSSATEPDPDILDTLRGAEFVKSALPFVELQTIARGAYRSQQGCLVRGIPADTAVMDPSLAERLSMEEGALSLADGNSVVLGAELARNLAVSVGDEISLLSLSGDALDSLAPEDAVFRVTGIFRSGFYEYDLGWAFVELSAAVRLHGGRAPFIYGVKLRDRWKDESAVDVLARSPRFASSRVQSWRVFNRAFFGALRTEKVMMFFLVGLIFVVVGLNVFQAQRRAALERREEIGLLRAVGASAFAVRLIFVCDGFLVGFFGAVLGMVPGLLISGNIGAFFGGMETLVNASIAVANFAVSLFDGGRGEAAIGEAFAVFSPTVFYIKEIPSRTVPLEAAAIFLFGLSSATAAAWFASARAVRDRPAEVLRYE